MKLYTNRGKDWELRNSFWVLFPVLSLGLLGFVAFLYIGMKLNNKKWALYSIAYLIPVIIAFIVPSDDIMAAIGIGVWAVSSIHALKIRPLYLIELDVKEEMEKEQIRNFREQIRSKYKNHTYTEEAAASDKFAQNHETLRKKTETKPDEKQSIGGETGHSLRQDSEQQPKNGKTMTDATTSAQPSPYEDTAGGEPADASSLKHTEAIQTPPGAESITETDETGKIDLNKATEEEIASIPAVGRILAKRIVAKRQELGGFTSFEQFVETIGLKPHTAEKLKPLVTFSHAKKEPRRGRIIDY